MQKKLFGKVLENIVVNKFKYAFFWALALLPPGLVYGLSYREAKKVEKAFFNSCNKDEFARKYKKTKLDQVLSIAGETEFYGKYLPDKNIHDWGLIDKDSVLQAGESMVLSKLGADLMTTGGTSGKPLAFYIDKSRKGLEWFWMTHGWSQVGFQLGKSWRAVLRNHELSGLDYVVNPLLKEVCFDNYRADEEYYYLITSEINRRNIEYVHAYPSAAYKLAIYWRDNGSMPKSIKAFLCGSENVFPEQKKVIEEDLGVRMMTWFGHSEKLVLAHEMKECQNYHANPFYGFTEIIDGDGEGICEQGKVGEIVGTGYINTRQPFVRYKTGDYAEYVGDICPQCGYVGLTFKNVRGRWNGEKIYLAEEEYVTTTSLNLHDSIYLKINGLQYYQDRLGVLEILVIPGDGWEAGAELDLIRSLEMKVPTGLQFKVRQVSELIYGKNRKYQQLIQKLKKD